MLTELVIQDQNTSSLGKTEHSFTVHVSGETISARELIRQRVFQEVEEYNQRQPAVFRLLVQPGDTERTLNGFKFSRPRIVDAEAQFRQAVAAFEANGFILLVDDRQIEELDTEIRLEPQRRVTFLKLVPLVGG
ncbi:MAG: hypothetical protein ACM3QS_12610 [Bacteroidota bacterium]